MYTGTNVHGEKIINTVYIRKYSDGVINTAYNVFLCNICRVMHILPEER